MKSIQRLLLEKVLKQHLSKLKGKVAFNLGTGVHSYKQFVKFERYITADCNIGVRPDICMDIHKLALRSACADVIIITEVLEHLKEPKKQSMRLKEC